MESDAYSRGYGLKYPRSEIVSAIFNKLVNQGDRRNEKLSIVDIGCGLGSMAMLTDNLPNSNYLGIDISPQAIQFAKERFSATPRKIEFLCIDTLLFLDTSRVIPDVVIDSASLQHHFSQVDINEQKFFMAKLSEFLGKGAIFSQWASEKNEGMTKNFDKFVGFESVRPVLEIFFDLTIHSIVETTFPDRISADGQKAKIVEFITILHKK
jgi:SAM-dependent methyltransferase